MIFVAIWYTNGLQNQGSRGIEMVEILIQASPYKIFEDPPPGYSSPTVVPSSQGPLKYTLVRDNWRYLAAVCLEGTSNGHWGVFTIVHCSEGLCVIPHLACTHDNQCLSGVHGVALWSALAAMFGRFVNKQHGHCFTTIVILQDFFVEKQRPCCFFKQS